MRSINKGKRSSKNFRKKFKIMNKRFVSYQNKILKKLLSNPEKRFQNGSNSKKKNVNNRTNK